MSPLDRWGCSRQHDVLDAIASHRWPARVDSELREHVWACASCRDLAEVAQAFADAPEDSDTRMPLPGASIVWWRSQLRAREEAARAASRPLRLAQEVALAVAILLTVAFLAGAGPKITSLAASAGTRVSAAAASIPHFDTDAARAAAQEALASRGVQLAAAAWLVLAPVALYLAFSRE